MTPEEKALAIAARIADGSAIDWPGTESGREGDPAVLDELKAIASLAALHRAPVVLDEAAGDGSKWGPLTRISKIGEGRFGAVYLAWDARLHRRVALKLLHLPSRAAADSPSHAIEEARLLARVRHPHVLIVHGAECLEGEIGIWTEFIEGRTLEAVVRERGPLPPDEAIAIGVTLCDALAAVHAAGLLHRDIKAQNVMRETGGRIVLMDFGTSHDLDAMPARAADLSGTPLYLAPELFDGEPATVASDVYAVAVLLFYLLTGRYPVSGRTLDEVRAAHKEGQRTRLDDYGLDLPARCIVAIEGGLAIARSTRHPDASTFRAALAAAALPDSRDGLRPRVPRRWWAAAAVLLVTVVAIIAAVALFVGGLRTRLMSGPPATVPGGTVAGTDGPAAAPAAPVTPAIAPTVASPISRAAAPPRHAPIQGPAQNDGEPGIRRVRLPTRQMGVPSSDGRYIPFIDDGGSVHVWEVATNQSRQLAVATPGESARFVVMSARGDRVVFGWSLPDGAFELRLINADATWPQVLIGRQTVFQPIPLDWSRDGAEILCWLRQKNGSVDLALVPVAGGAPSVLDSMAAPDVTGRGAPAGASLSPDGRFVVYFRRVAPSAPERALFIAGTDGAPPRVLLDAQAADMLPRWTPDGTRVLFVRMLSEVDGATTDAWTVRVVDGHAQGQPKVVTRKIGPVQNAFITDGGALYTQLSYSAPEINVLPFDPSGVSDPGPPTRVSVATVGNHVGPAWSPDGRSLAYFATHVDEPGTTPRRTLIIQDMATRKEHAVQPRLAFLGGYTPTWLPDSRSVIVWGRDGETPDRLGYYRIDVRTGDTGLVTLGDYAPAVSRCSPDGRELWFVDGKRGIVGRDLVGGQERVLVAMGARTAIGAFSVSPDAESIAFAATRRSGSELTYAVELHRPGNPPRELTARTPDRLIVQSWTVDGRSVLFTRSPTTSASQTLWKIDVSGGDARDTHLAFRGNLANGISFSPDGRQLAYTERDDGWELWIRRGLSLLK